MALMNDGILRYVSAEDIINGTYNIPNDIIGIGNESFSKYGDLQNLIIPDGVISIGESAFLDCESLEYIDLPSTITTIGPKAFCGCSNLKNIDIPDLVTSIASETFKGCRSLQSITLNNGITNIGNEAFVGCESLESMNLSNSVTQIGYGAFRNCNRLRKVALSTGITRIEDETFKSCINLEEVTIQPGITRIGTQAFSGCSKLKSIVIPNGTTNIGTEAFRGCKELTSISLPDTITSVGSYAFVTIPKLNTIKFGNIEIKDLKDVIGLTVIDKKLIILCKNQNEFRVISQNKEENFDLSIFGNIPSTRIQLRYDLLLEWKNLFTSKKGIVDLDTLSKLDDEIILNLPPTRENANLIRQKLKVYKEIKELAGFSREGNDNLFKMCFSLGLFSGNNEHFNYVREYIKSQFKKNSININRIFAGFNLESAYDEERALLLIQALNNKYFLDHPSDISRINNEYSQIKRFVRKEYKELIGRDLLKEIKSLTEKGELDELEKEKLSKLHKDLLAKQKGMGKIGLSEVIYYINNNELSIREGNEPLETIVGDLKAVNQAMFDRLQDIYESSREIKKEIIQTIDKNNDGGYTYQWSASDNPVNLVLGYMMEYCCAKLTGKGEDIMIQSMLNPLIQNLIIRDKNGNIVAKSTAYYNKEEQYILFNNIEARYDLNKEPTGYIRKEEIIKALKRSVDDQVRALSERGIEIKEIRMGMLRNDVLTEDDIEVERLSLLPNYPYSGYSGDANDLKMGQGILYRSKILENNSPVAISR